MELKLTSSFHPMNVLRWFFLCIHLKWNLLMWLFFYKYLLLKFLTWMKCKHKMNYWVVLRNLKWKGIWKRWEHESIVTYKKPENRPKFTSKSKMWLEKWEVTFWGPKGFTKKRENKHFYRNQMLQKRINKPRIDTKDCKWNWKTDLKNRQARKRRSCCLFQLMFL